MMDRATLHREISVVGSKRFLVVLLVFQASIVFVWLRLLGYSTKVEATCKFWLVILGPWCRFFLKFIEARNKVVTTVDVVLSFALVLTLLVTSVKRNRFSLYVTLSIFVTWEFSGLIYMLSWL